MDGMIATKKMIDNVIDGTTSPQFATESGHAETATKATQDNNGNVISATYATKQNANGGFEGGNGASAARGGAVGYNASATAGGGAVGQGANTTYGGAVGQGASSSTGFAGGYLAKATADGAVQLGEGTNATANTLQFRNTQIIDNNGNILDENGNVISETYAKQNGTYSSLTAGAATKATQDGNGDNIADTYQPKVEGVEMQYCGIELGDQSGTPSNAYIDFHVDGKPGDETDYNARIVAYSDFPKDLAVQLKDGGAFKVPSGQSFVPNGDSSEKATPTEFLQGATIFYNNNGSIGKPGYRGKSYNIILSSNFTTSGGGNINVTRSGNVITISGWVRNISVLNNGTAYVLLTGLPRTVAESMGVAPYASLNGVCRGFINAGETTLYFAPSFIVEGSTIAANSWFSISLTYITNE